MWQDLAAADPAPPPPARIGTAADWEVHYGGPDRPPGALRNLLLARIEAAPSGSEIVWATYYFRDRGLADALVAAHRRGVRVRILLDARPRRSDANAAVIARLKAGLGDGLHLHRAALPGPKLHAKIYAFSGPQPAVFVGSFNPSGNQPEDPEVVAEIGDQDRGHNLLVQFRRPRVTSVLLAQARRQWGGQDVSRFSPRQNRPIREGSKTFYFFPRLWPFVVESRIARLQRGDTVRAAVSHLGSGPFTLALTVAAWRGARVELVVHDTSRRVPDGVVTGLARAGVSIRRYCHPEHLPMHAKFVIIERGGQASAWFGSLNYNLNSRFLNREILVRSTDPALVSDLGRRFSTIATEARAFSAGSSTTGRCGRWSQPGVRIASARPQ